ncbi:hypothetical protein C6503_19215 [Candidatus Poribacteria bacterium]|nr:MAG: hypothetical protein C6503_19215 [Candidatus Poribacteria bacterium]
MNEPIIFHEYDPSDEAVGDPLQIASDTETAEGLLLGRTAAGIGREFSIERILAQILGAVPFAVRTAYRKGTLVYSSGDLYAVTATIEASNTQTLAQLLVAGTLVKVVDVEAKIANWAEAGDTTRIPIGKIPTSMPRALRTAAQTYALIRSLLDYNDLQNRPTLPVDTTLWEGAYADNTAYGAGDVVLYNNNLYMYTEAIPNDNTTKPDADTRAQRINTGAVTLRNAAQTYALIQGLLDYNDLLNRPTIPRLRTAAATARLLETLTDAARLSYTALKDTPPGVNILVPATLNRKDKTQVLPTNYTDYNTLRITTFSSRGNQEVTQDIATALLSAIATLTNYGSNANHSFSWVRSTRTITYTPSQSANQSGIIYCDLHS